MRVFLIVGLLAAFAPGALAHEVRPAYLEMRQTAPETYDVLWKVPGQGDLRLGIYVELPPGCTNVTEPHRSMLNNAYSERRTVQCPRRTHWRHDPHCGPQRDDDRYARAPSTSGWSHASHTPHPVRFVIRGRSRARHRRRPDLSSARRRTHPRWRRPSAVRARAGDISGGWKRVTDRDGIHPLAQLNARGGDARIRACPGAAGRSRHRAEHRVCGGGNHT